MLDWRARQLQSWAGLVGRHVIDWTAFDAAAFPWFVQCGVVRLELAGSPTTLYVSTHQNDTQFGLRLTDLCPTASFAPLNLRAFGPIRTVHLCISTADPPWHSGGDIVEASLTLDHQTMLLVAGESEAGPTGAADVLWADESVLLFERATDADRVPWRHRRPTDVIVIGPEGPPIPTPLLVSEGELRGFTVTVERLAGDGGYLIHKSRAGESFDDWVADYRALNGWFTETGLTL